MFIAAEGDMARTPSGVPCTALCRRHFTPKGVRLFARSDCYKHATTTWLLQSLRG
jgi:hypothetical protein